MLESFRGKRVTRMLTLVAVLLTAVAVFSPVLAWAVSAWVPQQSGTGTDLNGVSFADASHGWAVGYAGTILHTSDGGGTWTPQSSGAGARTLDSVSFADASHGLAVGEAGTIVSTSDGGAHWAAQTSGTLHDLNCVFFAHDATHAWAVGEAGTIVSTSDSGAHWTAQTSGTGEWLTAVTFIDASHGWALGNWAEFRVTSDGGAHWTEQPSGLEGTHNVFFAVVFADANDGWAVGYRGHILATTDGGATWTAQTSGTTSGLFSVACVDAMHVWAVGDGGRITATTDGGAHWKTQKSGVSDALTSVCTGGSSALWAVGGVGTILKTQPGAPETTVSGNIVGWSTSPETISLTPSGTAAPFSTFYYLNDSAATTYAAPFVISTQGTTTVTYWSVDSLAQLEATNTATVKIDSVLPASSVSGVSNGGTYVGSAQFQLSAIDTASGVAAVYCTIDGGPITAYSTPVTVLAPGVHAMSYWAVDKAGNTEAAHPMTFTVVAPVNKTPTALTISASPSSVRLPKPFVLSGLLQGAPTNGLPCKVMVKKPNKGYYSYSSARLTYNAAGSASSWWYRYTPTMRGTYTFYVTFAGNGTYLASPRSAIVRVTVK